MCVGEGGRWDIFQTKKGRTREVNKQTNKIKKQKQICVYIPGLNFISLCVGAIVIKARKITI